jgi:hypothetical protein
VNVTRVVGSLALTLGAGICGGVGASGVVAAQEPGAARSESAGSTRAHNLVGEDSRGLWSIDYTVDSDGSELAPWTVTHSRRANPYTTSPS